MVRALTSSLAKLMRTIERPRSRDGLQCHPALARMNLIDATVPINVLRLLGNPDAELIATSGAGYRPDGSRNPHSWSNVDERALTQWLSDRLRNSNRK